MKTKTVRTIILNGMSVSYTQTKTDRRSISASVDNDGIIQVRTPKSITDTYVREFIYANAEKILQMLARSRVRSEYEEHLADGELERLRALAKIVIPERVRYFGKVMGVSPNSVKINSARTRFGSCSSRGNLNFSCRVMAYSAKAVDYVVIHELAHLTHMDHSKAFWSTVSKYMPDYNVARQELKGIPSGSL